MKHFFLKLLFYFFNEATKGQHISNISNYAKLQRLKIKVHVCENLSFLNFISDLIIVFPKHMTLIDLIKTEPL